MRKKKIIAIVLAGVLVAVGLGSFAYALDEPVNDVLVESQTTWSYFSPEDPFYNGQVTGSRLWGARITNRTGETLANVRLRLASDLALDLVNPEPVTMGPPTYKWSFGEIPVGASQGATVSFVSSDPSPVTFIPGFDASRSADITEFLQSARMQVQTITITATPCEAIDMFAMGVRANENEWVNPVITSCRLEDDSGGDKFTFNLSPDGHVLHMWQNDPVVDTKYTYTVTIEVTPKVDKVEFLPFVQVVNLPKYSITPGGTDSKVTYAADGMDTWTWRTGGNYTWAIAAGEPFRGVNWHPSSREIIEPIPHEPMTGQKLVGYGFYGTHDFEELDDATYDLHTMFTFTNPDGVSEITIERVSILDRYGTVLYEGPLKPGTEERIVMPHEVDAVELHDYLELPRDIDPVTVEIFWTKSIEEGLPLIGWALTAYALFDKEGNLVEVSTTETQMVNLEQKLN